MFDLLPTASRGQDSSDGLLVLTTPRRTASLPSTFTMLARMSTTATSTCTPATLLLPSVPLLCLSTMATSRPCNKHLSLFPAPPSTRETACCFRLSFHPRWPSSSLGKPTSTISPRLSHFCLTVFSECFRATEMPLASTVTTPTFLTLLSCTRLSEKSRSPPPPEDMNPEDPDMIPREQELRFEGDLYTPRWVRGHGNKREGWCGICKPGRWLVLKNSAFWYDKSFSHGISAATGSSFQEPQQKRRMDGNPDVWEGLCGSCEQWIALVSSKKKGTTWFRHAYKCHTHLKVKDTPKRRRESSNARALAMSTMAKPKTEVQHQRPMTPQMPASSMELATTPRPSTMSQITSHPQVTSVLAPQEHYTIDPMSGNVLTTEPFPNMI
ncbi:hypothetical protein NW765_009067 [Fusarium oxysporum]|nr:hypothetical protein NW765_009067 [Fusarium oxysporum]